MTADDDAAAEVLIEVFKLQRSRIQSQQSQIEALEIRVGKLERELHQQEE
jgi:hypothetical protein